MVPVGEQLAQRLRWPRMLKRSFNPGPELLHGRGRLALGRALGQDDLDSAGGVDVHPDAPSAG
jgi:hypothetical protein